MSHIDNEEPEKNFWKEFKEKYESYCQKIDTHMPRIAVTARKWCDRHWILILGAGIVVALLYMYYIHLSHLPMYQHPAPTGKAL
jgi:hypothetical protein